MSKAWIRFTSVVRTIGSPVTSSALEAATGVMCPPACTNGCSALARSSAPA